jgi:hypothetical protein
MFENLYELPDAIEPGELPESIIQQFSKPVPTFDEMEQGLSGYNITYDRRNTSANFVSLSPKDIDQPKLLCTLDENNRIKVTFIISTDITLVYQYDESGFLTGASQFIKNNSSIDWIFEYQMVESKKRLARLTKIKYDINAEEKTDIKLSETVLYNPAFSQ